MKGVLLIVALCVSGALASWVSERQHPPPPHTRIPACTARELGWLWPNFDDPTRFWQCGGINWVHNMPCAPGTRFSFQYQICVHPHQWVSPPPIDDGCWCTTTTTTTPHPCPCTSPTTPTTTTIPTTTTPTTTTTTTRTTRTTRTTPTTTISDCPCTTTTTTEGPVCPCLTTTTTETSPPPPPTTTPCPCTGRTTTEASICFCGV